MIPPKKSIKTTTEPKNPKINIETKEKLLLPVIQNIDYRFYYLNR